MYLGHAGVELFGVALVHLIPVEPDGLCLVVEEAVVLVYYVPESFEVAVGRVGIFVYIHAGGEEEEKQYVMRNA